MFNNLPKITEKKTYRHHFRYLSNEKTYVLLANVGNQLASGDISTLLRITGNFKTKIPSITSERKEGYVDYMY